ncbi:unnamed protein product, partial [Phaeothamnion confervicola]
QLQYTVLRVLPFNSVRKRMSVILRTPEGHVCLMCKGADTTMLPLMRIDTPQSLLTTTVREMEGMAAEGLRTLLVGSLDWEESAYAKWNAAYDEAINDVEEQVKKGKDLPNRIDDLQAEAEKGLTLLGATAIEDKLQDGVGETIDKLIRGGIIIWVITGDKEETAINIGVACQLL